MYIYMYRCVYIYIYIYTHTHTHTHVYLAVTPSSPAAGPDKSAAWCAPPRTEEHDHITNDNDHHDNTS